MSLYAVKEFFDTKLAEAGFTVNSGSLESSTDVTNGAYLFTYISEIRQAPEQSTGFYKYQCKYIIKTFQAAEFDAGIETKSKEDALSDNYDTIVRTVMNNVNGSNADNIELVDGEQYYQTDTNYQCFSFHEFDIYKKIAYNI